jgi:hypothetical protein
MAHYVAQLIEATEVDPSNEDARAECVRVILQLWDHRSTLESRERPLQSFDPVLETLARLSSPTPLWRRFTSGARAGTDNGSRRFAALEFATELDQAMGALLRFLVVDTVSEVAAEEAEWLEASSHLEYESKSVIESVLNTFQTDDGTDSQIAAGIKTIKRTRSALKKFEAALRKHRKESAGRQEQ